MATEACRQAGEVWKVINSRIVLANCQTTLDWNKPEPIMLLILPIILSRISQIFYPLFSMPSPIIPIIFFKFLLCL